MAVVGGGCAGLSAALQLASLSVGSPIDLFHDGAAPARDVGVGIWSTGLNPLAGSEAMDWLYKELVAKGQWVDEVGYRVPRGDWLLKSVLTEDPGLLFLRESDFLVSLRKAVHLEEHRGSIQVHSASPVQRLDEESPHPWSARLQLVDGRFTDRDYHLIIAADGTHSKLRQVYGGHNAATRTTTTVNTGTSALPGPTELPPPTSAWSDEQQKEAIRIQDRGYTVFRGNAVLPHTGQPRNVGSFQTWGECQSMRFATVPMPIAAGSSEERQAWFITTDNPDIPKDADPDVRLDMLRHEFRDWHQPIPEMLDHTPAAEIVMERAIAHRHCMGPVTSMNEVIGRVRGRRPPSSGEGPVLVYVGDAFMTIDPILAQGFTVALEGAAALRTSVDAACQQPSEGLAFCPSELRTAIRQRHEARIERLVCLLRATELVQALGQPTGGVGGSINLRLLRPLAQMVPNSIKAPIFDRILRYSLGWPKN